MKSIFSVLILLCSFNCYTYSQQSFDVFISNSGSDSNAGKTSFTPLRSFGGSVPLIGKIASEKGSVQIGLESGNHFNDVFNPAYPVEIGSYYNSIHKKDFAVLNGSEEYNIGWTLVDRISNVFRQSISIKGFSGEAVGGYNYIFVVEIDKELEKTLPYTSRKILTFASSIDKAGATPGSFYEAATTSDSITIFVHTTDGKSPNLHNKYRYEITVRNRAVNSYDYDNNKFENLWVRGFGAGYGSLPGGNNSYYNKVIFGPGAATHHVVLKNGVINNSLFLPGATNLNSIAATFYNVEGFGKTGKISNSIFLDIPNAIYSHTSYGSHYAKIELDNVIGFADEKIGGLFISTSDNDTVKLNNVYTDKYSIGLNVGHNNISANYISITNSCFKDVTTCVSFGSNLIKADINNTLITSGKKNNVAAIAMLQNTRLALKQSIIHLKNPGNQSAFINRSFGSNDHLIATGNIFIADVDRNNDVPVGYFNAVKADGGLSDNLNNNIYVLVSGKNMLWSVRNKSAPGVSTTASFEEWKKISGQDGNSLFFDLRNDPRGLKAIFRDPENGNYELANTSEANKIRALKAGITQPITCFLKKPTYEEAAEIIRSGKMLTMNSCKNPCLGTALFASSFLNSATINNSQVLLKWVIKDNKNIDHIDIERSTGNSEFSKIYSSVVGNDSTYTFIDNNITSEVSYKYRLVIHVNGGEKCYSMVNTVTHTFSNYKLDIYPNPTRNTLRLQAAGYSGLATLIILNPVGQAISQKEITLITGIPQKVDLPKHSKGTYWIKLQLKDGTLVKSFVVE